MDRTISYMLSNSSMLDYRLPMLLDLAGEANVGARLKMLIDAANAAHEAVKMFSAPSLNVFDLPGPMGCDDETFAKIVGAHTDAMAARDLFFAREVKPIIDAAERANG
jgi:hypothetical protein